MGSSTSLRHTLIRPLATAFALMGIIGSIGAYAIGDHYVTQAYDRDLSNDLMTLASHTERVDQHWRADFPTAAQRWLLANEGEHVIYRIVDLERHVTLVSHGEFEPLSNDAIQSQHDHFRTQTVHGVNFRIGAITLPMYADDSSLLIEVGETLGRRERLAEHLMWGMLLLFLSVTSVATVLVWRGLNRALQPLHTLEHQMSERSAADLTPLEPSMAPDEVHGLITAINQMMGRVAQSVDAQSRFIANVAHQLRTPVAGLRLHAQLALDCTSHSSSRTHLDGINTGAKRLSHLIEQLLLLALASSGEPASTDQEVDLMDVVLTVIERHLPTALNKGIDLGFEGAAIHSVVIGNRILLEELLANLIDNAIRYSHLGGNVTVSIEYRSNGLCLRVKDDGPGMDDSNGIFLRFRKGNLLSHEGAGLGLAIVKEISDAHQASIFCATAPGAGVDITVTFSKMAAIQPPAKEGLKKSLAGCKTEG